MNNTRETTRMSFDQTFDYLIEKLENIDSKLEDSNTKILANDLGIDPMKTYTVRETAKFLRIDDNSVYKIPRNELPTVRRIGTGIGFLGIQILRYMHGLDPMDFKTVVEELSECIQRSLNSAATRNKVIPLNTASKETRLL